jgi:hypothetical protein
MKNPIEPAIQVKLNNGLPLTGPEFCRTVVALVAQIQDIQKELNELKISVSRSRVDQDNEGVGTTTKLRPKSNQ